MFEVDCGHGLQIRAIGINTGQPANYVSNPNTTQDNYDIVHPAARAIDSRHTDNYETYEAKGTKSGATVRIIENSKGQQMVLYKK